MTLEAPWSLPTRFYEWILIPCARPYEVYLAKPPVRSLPEFSTAWDDYHRYAAHVRVLASEGPGVLWVWLGTSFTCPCGREYVPPTDFIDFWVFRSPHLIKAHKSHFEIFVVPLDRSIDTNQRNDDVWQCLQSFYASTKDELRLFHRGRQGRCDDPH